MVQPVARLRYHGSTITMAQLRRTSLSSVTPGSLPPSLHVALTAVAALHTGKNTMRVSFDGWMSEVKTPNRTTTRCAMVQALGRRPLTAETRVRSQSSSCGICGGQNSSGTGFFSGHFAFPLSVSFQCPISHLHVNTVLTGAKGRSLGTFPKAAYR